MDLNTWLSAKGHLRIVQDRLSDRSGLGSEDLVGKAKSSVARSNGAVMPFMLVHRKAQADEERGCSRFLIDL